MSFLSDSIRAMFGRVEENGEVEPVVHLCELAVSAGIGINDGNRHCDDSLARLLLHHQRRFATTEDSTAGAPLLLVLLLELSIRDTERFTFLRWLLD